MKKVISLLLVCCMALAVFVSCNKKQATSNPTDAPSGTPAVSGSGTSTATPTQPTPTAPSTSTTTPSTTTPSVTTPSVTTPSVTTPSVTTPTDPTTSDTQSALPTPSVPLPTDPTEGGDSSDEDTTPTETDDRGQEVYTTIVPVDDLDFEGEEINILVRSDVGSRREFGKDAATDTGFTDVDYAISARNEKVKNTLNCSHKLLPEESGNFDDYLVKFDELITDDYVTNGNVYHVIANFAYAAGGSTLRECFANLMDKEIFPHFAFEAPCWNQAIVNSITLNNKLYLITGDINLSVFDRMIVLWVNTTKYNARADKYQGTTDLVQYALDGNWTSHDFFQWFTLTEGQTGEHMCTGLHGFGNDAHFFDTIPHAWDLEFVKKNDAQLFEFNIKGNLKAEGALSDLRRYMDLEGVVTHTKPEKECTCGITDRMTGHFVAGDFVFFCSSLWPGDEAILSIRNMTDDYNVLPIPKFDEDQKSYGTTSGDSYNLMSVMKHQSLNGEMISAYLQHTTDESYNKVRAYYIQDIVTPAAAGKATDEEALAKATKLVNVIMDTLEFDLATLYSRGLNDIGWLWRDNIQRSTMDLATAFTSNSLSGSGNQRTELDYLAAITSFNNWIYDLA